MEGEARSKTTLITEVLNSREEIMTLMQLRGMEPPSSSNRDLNIRLSNRSLRDQSKYLSQLPQVSRILVL